MSDIGRLCSEYMDSELPEDVKLSFDKLMREDHTVREDLDRMQALQAKLERLPIPNCADVQSQIWQRVCKEIKEERKIFRILPIPVFASLFIALVVLPYLTDQVGFMAEYWQESSNNTLADIQTTPDAEALPVIDDLIIQDDFDDLISRLKKNMPSNNIITLPASTPFSITGEPLLIPIRNIADQ